MHAYILLRTSLVAQTGMREARFDPWVGKIPCGVSSYIGDVLLRLNQIKAKHRFHNFKYKDNKKSRTINE